MPKLGEMLYVSALSLSSEITAKLLHLAFGILVSGAIYKFSRKYFDKTTSILAVVIFYSNIVVAWQSTTAYIDLIRTFFEFIAFWGFINWWETKKIQWLVESGVILGLAASTKIIGLSSLFIFLIFIIAKKKNRLKNCLIFIVSTVSILSPWLIFSFLQTGNPVSPLFTNLVPAFHLSQLNPITIIMQVFNLFTSSSDPVSPIYLILLPLILINLGKLKGPSTILLGYCLLALLFLCLIPTTDIGRFYMPYLPVFSVLSASLFSLFSKSKSWQFAVLSIALVLSLTTIGYRAVAEKKYLPVVLGKESKSKFLSDNLNFSFGDFYDTDGFFKNRVAENQKALLFGFHNLYYVDFPFIDSSWVKKGDRFNYVVVQNTSVPERFKYWNLIYSNNKTHVKVYSLGGAQWGY